MDGHDAILCLGTLLRACYRLSVAQGLELADGSIWGPVSSLKVIRKIFNSAHNGTRS